MRDEKFVLSRSADALNSQLPQRLLSWSGHVLSWVEQRAIPVQLLRYEDMHSRPAETFAAAVRSAGLPDDRDRLRRALANSSFPVLQAQEQEHGFRERPEGARAFFRRGRPGSWQKGLSAGQVTQLLRDHGDVMRRYGYVTPDGQPV